MLTEFVKGQAKKFVASNDFALNWDNRNIPSVKVREGQTVLYDGEIALYVKSDGEEIKGRCIGLRSAINIMGWLIPSDITETVVEPEVDPNKSCPDLFVEPDQPDQIPESDFDSVKGGSFDTFANQNNDIHVVGSKGTEVIKEDDLIVKEIPPIEKTKVIGEEDGKLEVAGDQVQVKEVPDSRLIVNSSTVTPKKVKRTLEVTQADEMGADSTQPIKTAKVSEPTKKKTYIVDNQTPRTIHEDMTKEEVQRITKVINADESQDARVVKKLDKSKMDVKEIEGVTLRKTESPKDIAFNKTVSPKDMSVKTTISSGSTPIADISAQEPVVVSKEKKAGEKTGDALIADIFDEPTEKKVPKKTEEVSEKTEEKATEKKVPEKTEKEKTAEKKAIAAKKAKERAITRKKSSAKTQKQMESEKAPKEILDVQLDAKVTDEPQTEIDYISMLPDDWGKLHWVKKEKFIKELTNIAFIKFIFSVEKIKAVQNACAERLKTLGQKKSG